jgi:hypothetical protein
MQAFVSVCDFAQVGNQLPKPKIPIASRVQPLAARFYQKSSLRHWLSSYGVYVPNFATIAIMSAPHTGRTKSKLTPEIHKLIVETVRATGTISSAARRAGIDEATARWWMMRGRDSRASNKYRQFFLDCEKAKAAFLIEDQVRHHEIAIGGVVRRPRLKTITLDDGSVVKTNEIELDKYGRPVMVPKWRPGQNGG